MSDETVLAPAAEPEVVPAPEPQAPETPPEGQGAAPEAKVEPPATPEPAPKKSPVSQLQGRVGHLTKTLHEKDAELERLRLQNETMQALLGTRQTPSEGEPTPAPARVPVGRGGPGPAPPVPGTPEFDQYVDARAAQIAADSAYQAEANRVNAEGKQKFGPAWDESLTALNTMGILQRNFVEAAFASGDPVGVLSQLGEDLEEATRIASLPPIRMAAELTKIATRPVAAAAPAAPAVSRAPAPITPVNGAVNPTTDIYDPKLSSGDKVSEEFLKARAKSGSPWHQRHK